MGVGIQLQVALDHGKAGGIIKSRDRVVVCQKVGDSAVVKIIEIEWVGSLFCHNFSTGANWQNKQLHNAANWWCSISRCWWASLLLPFSTVDEQWSSYNIVLFIWGWYCLQIPVILVEAKLLQLEICTHCRRCTTTTLSVWPLCLETFASTVTS